MATRVITLLAFSYAPEAGQNQIAVPNNVIWDMPDGQDWLTCDPPKAKLFDPSGDQNLADEIAARINADEVLAAAISSEATLRAEADALKADNATTVSGAGLATGGGSLAANRTITVASASQAEVIAGTETAKAVTPAALPNATDAARGLAKQMFTNDGTHLRPNHTDTAVQNAIKVRTPSGSNQGNIGIHTTPSVQIGYDTHESGQALHQKGLVFPAAPYNDAVATSSKIVVAPYSVRTAAFTGEFTQILTQIPLNATTRANYTLTVRLHAFGSGNSAVDYKIRFTTNSPYGSGGIDEYGVSVSGGVISNRLSSVYIANVGGFVAIVFQSPHLFSTPVFISILDATVTYQNAGSADALYLTGFTTSILTATPAGAILLTTRNDFANINAAGTITSTGNMSAPAFIVTSNRDEKENFTPIDFEKIELTGKRLHEIQRDPKQYGYFTYKGSADQREGFYDAQYLYDQIAVIDENLALQIAPITQNFQAEQVIEGKTIAEIPMRRALDYSKIEKCKSAWTSRLAIADYVHTGTSRFITVPQLSRVLSLGRWLPIVATIMSQTEAVKNQLLGALVALALAGGAELDSEDVQQLLLALVSIGAITNDEFADISNL